MSGPKPSRSRNQVTRDRVQDLGVSVFKNPKAASAQEGTNKLMEKER